ncbi:LuxR C-terminal-related transcriptional regulator [Streptomyces sp. NPDC047525]|uniref:helix-turn-helix transcriptional regulator n=1 Tax=Streptomyces sp. NPDC047525 TaxID=3155264 RepID=UPI0033CE4492
MTTEPHSHGPDELCEAGTELYIRALRENHVPRQDAASAPCLVDFGLLYPDEADARRLRPRPPAVALPQLLGAVAQDIADQRDQQMRLAAAFAPLMNLRTGTVPVPATTRGAAVTVLRGLPRINEAIDRAVAATSEEVLTIQPGGARPPDLLVTAVPPEQSMLSRGARMRTLYQHTTRHSLATLAHFEQLDGDVEVRTLDEVTERLLVFDRTVAFIPADAERSAALELRHPAVIEFLVTAFHRLWHLATPMFPHTAPQPARDGITARQRAIATLLTEGLTDTEIAARLGMNVRTARVHIAKLATVLGSQSRTQLGYLIGRSGILNSGT